MARAVTSASLTTDSVFVASAGLTSTPTRLAVGSNSRRSSSRFAANSVLKKLTPVRLPPGRARLATRPSLAGSSPTRNTIGIVVVAALAAKAAGRPPIAAITATSGHVIVRVGPAGPEPLAQDRVKEFRPGEVIEDHGAAPICSPTRRHRVCQRSTGSRPGRPGFRGYWP